MTTRCDARLDVLLDTLCAVAEVLPAQARHDVAVSLARRVAARCPADEGADTAVAGDVARMLEALGLLPCMGRGASASSLRGEPAVRAP